MQRVGRIEPVSKPQEEMKQQPQQTWTSSSVLYIDRKKRHRRTAGEIQRHYKCPARGCYKSYG